MGFLLLGGKPSFFCTKRVIIWPGLQFAPGDSRVKPGNDTVAKPEMTQCSPLPWTLSKYRHCSVHTAPSTGSGSGWTWDDGRLFGLLLFRLETVQLDALLFQLPPRLTRLEPDAAPVPNVFCWALPLCFAEKFCPCAPFCRAPKGALYTERNFFLFRPGTDNTEAEAVVAVARVEAAEPVGDIAAGRIAVPAATAPDAVRPRRGTSGRGARAYGAVPVPAPLPHVAAHVV